VCCSVLQCQRVTVCCRGRMPLNPSHSATPSTELCPTRFTNCTHFNTTQVQKLAPPPSSDPENNPLRIISPPSSLCFRLTHFCSHIPFRTCAFSRARTHIVSVLLTRSLTPSLPAPLSPSISLAGSLSRCLLLSLDALALAHSLSRSITGAFSRTLSPFSQLLLSFCLSRAICLSPVCACKCFQCQWYVACVSDR